MQLVSVDSVGFVSMVRAAIFSFGDPDEASRTSKDDVRLEE
jgi:hypothetical protein